MNHLVLNGVRSRWLTLHVVNLALDRHDALVRLLLLAANQQSVNCAHQLLGKLETQLVLEIDIFGDELEGSEQLS